jgi:hypothetical protein
MRHGRKPILGRVALRDGDVPLFFYELHESDTDLFAEVLLAHETEYDEAEFLELVLESRSRVLESFTEDSLVEAVAADLAARAGFLVLDDSQLRVAVNVSAQDEGTFVSELQVTSAAAASRTDYRTLLVDVDPEDSLWGDDRQG